MKLSMMQKAEAALSAYKHKSELKQLLIRRYWRTHKVKKVKVGGVTAEMDTSDFLSNMLLWQNEFPDGYEPAVSELLVRLIKNSKFYADVGGNIGYFSILPAVANPECRIFYFEMDASIKPLLIKNIRLNRLEESRITIVNAAVGDRDGELEYVPHPYSFLSKLGNENIDVYDLKCRARLISLDDYFLRQNVTPDLLKIDIDGGEMSALRGMKRIILTAKPKLLLEVHPYLLPLYGSSATEVCEFLREHGYLFYLVQDFRESKMGQLSQIFDFDGLTSKSGDMIFVTTEKPSLRHLYA